MNRTQIRIGGASGFWGDASIATPQLLSDGALDYLVYDYLAEITMSIMARARAADNSKGFATDFVDSTLKANLCEIARQGVKLIANAGGVNPRACAIEVQALVDQLGLDLTVAVVLGDDLLARKDEFYKEKHPEMFTGQSFPDAESVISINTYLGAFPIAHALNQGADIVITGRCVDSAVTLGACIHEFGWSRSDTDQLAQGSLAGHILECGTQATGGNFTDWESVVDSLFDAGYPIAEISTTGEFVITKPQATGGAVTVGTVAEQMLYEIGDPQAYYLPDVICDFSEVKIQSIATDRVRVTGAKGQTAPEQYKVSATYTDGFRAGHIVTFYGRDADVKANKYAENVLKRSSKILKKIGFNDFSETCIEIIGAETHYGAARKLQGPREVDLKIAVKHDKAKGVAVFLKELVGLFLSGPPGLTGFAGARPKPSPVVRLFSMLIPKNDIEIQVDMQGKLRNCSDVTDPVVQSNALVKPSQHFEIATKPGEVMQSVSLESLAWARSGDKGNKANIGVIAREPEFLPWIAQALTADFVARYFEHFIDPDPQHPGCDPVERFYLPGIHALNFLLHGVLGGGGMASLRSDPQGKGYAQLLLAEAIQVPESLLKEFKLKSI